MDISVEKLNLIQQILLIKDENLLEKITDLINGKRGRTEEADGWDELPERQKEAIRESIAQVEAGQGIPLTEVLAKYRESYGR